MKTLEISSNAIPEDCGGVRVEAIHVKVGKLCAVVPESLRCCFDIVRQDTVFSGADLRNEEVPVVVRCRERGVEKTIEEPNFVCGECGAGRTILVSGRELNVVSIELAEPERPAASEG